MCGRCEGEPYRGVKALFNGDLQAKMEHEDRADWLVLSDTVIVYLGASALALDDRALLRGCDTAVQNLSDTDRAHLAQLALSLGRPAFGRP